MHMLNFICLARQTDGKQRDKYGETQAVTDDLAAEAGIRQLHARYADAVFRKDFVSFGDCFTPDAVWRLGPHVLRGRAEAVAFLIEKTANSRFVLMNFGTPILSIGDGTATGRTPVVEKNVFHDAPPSHRVATYYEHFIAQEGVWRRAYALFALHYMGPDDYSGDFYPIADYGPPPSMPKLEY